MFCSNCGNEISEGLKYCSRCGARIVSELEKTNSSTLTQDGRLAQNLSRAIGFIGTSGVIALAILIGNLIRKDFIFPAAVMLVLIFAALVFGIIYLLVRQISLVSGNARQIYQPNFQKREALPKPDTARLISYNQPIASVTENTTRNFEPIFVKDAEK